MEQPQTPEQLQFISNIAHWIEGGILAVVALIALAQATGYAKSKGAQYLWPGLILIAGLFLPAFILLQRGMDKVGVSWNLIIRDPQQREHLLMAFLLVVVGGAEILHRAGIFRGQLWKFLAPVALVMIGAILFVHTEYGTPEAIAEAVTKHRYQGTPIILAGVFRAAEVLWHHKQKWLAFAWIVMLLAASVLLISYREPEGAYRTDSSNSHSPLGATAARGGEVFSGSKGCYPSQIGTAAIAISA